MRGRRRKRWGLAFATVVPLAVAAVVALPHVVERYIESTLRQAGWQVDLDVDAVGLGETRLRRLAIRQPGAGQPELSMTGIRVRYRLRELVSGHLDSIAVATATWACDAKGLQRWLGEEPSARPALAATPISVDDLVVVSARDGHPLATGSLRVDERGRLDGRLYAVVAGVKTEARAHLDGRGSGRVELSVLSRGQGSFAVDARELRGAASIELVEGALVSARGHLQGRDVWVHGAYLGAVAVDLGLDGAALRASATGAFGRVAVASEVPWRGGAVGTVLPFEVDAELNPSTVASLASTSWTIGAHADSPAVVHGRGTLVRAGAAWIALLPELQLAMRLDEVEAGGYRASAVDVEATASLHLSPELTLMTIAPGARVESSRVALASMRGSLTAGRMTLARPGLIVTTGDGIRVLAVSRLRLQGEDLQVAAADDTMATRFDVPIWITADSAGLRAGFGAGGRAVVRLPAALVAPVQLPKRVGLAIDPSSSPAFDTRSSRLRASVALDEPVALGGKARAVVEGLRVEARAEVHQGHLAHVGLSGSLSARDLEWQGMSLSSFDGRFARTPSGWNLAGVAKADAEPIFVSASAPLSAREVQVRVSAPRVSMSRTHSLGHFLAEHLGMAARGSVAVHGRVAITDGRPRAELTASFTDLAVSDLGARTTLLGARGQLRFLYDGTLRTDGMQSVHWRQLRVGDQRLGAGRVRFALGAATLDVDGLSIGLGAGQVSVEPFTVSRSSPRARVTVSVTGVDLRRWLPVVSRGSVRGTGIVDGKVTATLSPHSFSIATGRFVTRGPGRLQVADARRLRALVDTKLRTANIVSKTVGRRVVAALCDFDYERLALEFLDGAGPEARLLVEGQGHRGPQRIQLEVDASGAEEFAVAALRRAGRASLAAAAPHARSEH